MKKISIILLNIALVIFWGWCYADADSLEDLDPNTSTSGWTYSTQNGHMGTKVSTYKYSSDEVRRAYADYVVAGIGMWTSYISMSYSASSTQGLFKISNETSGATASTLVTAVDANGHRTQYEVTIFSYSFDTNSDEGKARTIAHEIGHVYGLGHVNTTGDIMYDTYSETKAVTSASRNGMKVVTHVHTHSASTSGTYVATTQSQHGLLCSTCKGIYYSSHTLPSAYQYNTTSHWRVCSSCGNTVGMIGHSYIDSGSYKQCRFCGYITYDTNISSILEEIMIE